MKEYCKTLILNSCRYPTLGILAAALALTLIPDRAQASSKKLQKVANPQAQCTISLSQIKVPSGPYKGTSYAKIVEWISSHPDFITSTFHSRLLKKTLADLPKQHRLYAQNSQLCHEKLSQLKR